MQSRDHSRFTQLVHTRLRDFLTSGYHSVGQSMQLLKHFMQQILHSLLGMLPQDGQLLRLLSSQHTQSPWKMCPQLSLTVPPFCWQAPQVLGSHPLTSELFHFSDFSSPSLTVKFDGSDSMFVGRELFVLLYSIAFIAMQVTTAMAKQRRTTVAMINRALVTHSPVSQLASYQPWQVRQASGGLTEVSHSSQFSRVHAVWLQTRPARSSKTKNLFNILLYVSTSATHLSNQIQFQTQLGNPPSSQSFQSAGGLTYRTGLTKAAENQY